MFLYVLWCRCLNCALKLCMSIVCSLYWRVMKSIMLRNSLVIVLRASLTFLTCSNYRYKPKWTLTSALFTTTMLLKQESTQWQCTVFRALELCKRRKDSESKNNAHNFFYSINTSSTCIFSHTGLKRSVRANRLRIFNFKM